MKKIWTPKLRSLGSKKKNERRENRSRNKPIKQEMILEAGFNLKLWICQHPIMTKATQSINENDLWPAPCSNPGLLKEYQTTLCLLLDQAMATLASLKTSTNHLFKEISTSQLVPGT